MTRQHRIAELWAAVADRYGVSPRGYAAVALRHVIEDASEALEHVLAGDAGKAEAAIIHSSAWLVDAKTSIRALRQGGAGEQV
jgi:hypothetical protein